MAESSVNMDVDKLISYGDDLIKVIQDRRDDNSLKHCLEHYKALSSYCEADFSEVQSLLKDYENKIEVCKQKTKEARSEVASDEELELLQKEFEEVREQERLLQLELREVGSSINDLELERISVQERRKAQKRLDREEMKTQRTLSLYASVTNVIPLVDQVMTSGYIVDRDKKLVQKFEFDSARVTSFDTCNSIWKMMN